MGTVDARPPSPPPARMTLFASTTRSLGNQSTLATKGDISAPEKPMPMSARPATRVGTVRPQAKTRVPATPKRRRVPPTFFGFKPVEQKSERDLEQSEGEEESARNQAEVGRGRADVPNEVGRYDRVD